MLWLLLALARACEHHLTQRPTIVVRPEYGDAGFTLPGYEFLIRSQRRKSDPDTKRELVHVLPPSGQIVRLGTNRATEIVEAGALTLSEPTLETPGKVLTLRTRDLSTIIGTLTATKLMVTGIETFAASSDLRRIAVQEPDGMLTVADLQPSPLRVLGSPHPIAHGVRPLEYIGDTLLGVSDRGELILYGSDRKVISKTRAESVQPSVESLLIHEATASRHVALFDDRRLILADLSFTYGGARLVQEVPEEIVQATFGASETSLAFAGEHLDGDGFKTATVGVLELDWTQPENPVRLAFHRKVAVGKTRAQAEVVRDPSEGWVVAVANEEGVHLSRLDSSGLTRLQTLPKQIQPGSLALWRERDHVVVRFRTKESSGNEIAESYELRQSGSKPWVPTGKDADRAFRAPRRLPALPEGLRGFLEVRSSDALGYEWDGKSRQAVDPQSGRSLYCTETGELIRLESFAKKNRQEKWLVSGPKGSYFVFYQRLDKPGWQVFWMSDQRAKIDVGDIDFDVVIDPERGLVPRYEAPGVLVIPTREGSGFIRNLVVAVYQ